MNLTKLTQKYKSLVADRWHTPGHKGVLWDDDITEIDDGEYFPAGAVEQAQKDAAALYGAKELRFLTGGSSMGVKAAILAADGDILAASNSHRSVFEGAALAKTRVHVAQAPVTDGLPAPLTADIIESGLKEHPDVKAVLITSPDYFGRVCEREVEQVVRAKNKLLIADSAHGAHFALRRDLFPHCFSQTADFCNLSAHKTMCALTMGAYLCVNNTDYIGRADEALKNLGTTSPLYPLLASLENAVEVGRFQSPLYDNLKACVAKFKEKIPTLENDDFTRVVVNAEKLGFSSGKELYGALLKSGIAAETYSGAYTVFIATPFDDGGKFERLARAIGSIAIP